jgi:hypothetical protein
MWKNTVLAYLAGIIDGEGCISLRRILEKGKCAKWDIRIYVVSTDKILIDWLQSNFGGTTYSRISKKNPHWKRKHEWIISKKALTPILTAIYPFLVIKKQHCEIAIKFRETYTDGLRNRLSSQLLEIRHECFENLKKLNHRGLN